MGLTGPAGATGPAGPRGLQGPAGRHRSGGTAGDRRARRRDRGRRALRAARDPRANAANPVSAGTAGTAGTGGGSARLPRVPVLAQSAGVPRARRRDLGARRVVGRRRRRCGRRRDRRRRRGRRQLRPRHLRGVGGRAVHAVGGRRAATACSARTAWPAARPSSSTAIAASTPTAAAPRTGAVGGVGSDCNFFGAMAFLCRQGYPGSDAPGTNAGAGGRAFFGSIEPVGGVGGRRRTRRSQGPNAGRSGQHGYALDQLVASAPQGRRARPSRARQPRRRIATGSIRVARHDGTSVATRPTVADRGEDRRGGDRVGRRHAEQQALEGARRQPGHGQSGDQADRRSGGARPAPPSRPVRPRRRPSPCGCRSRGCARGRAATARRRRSTPPGTSPRRRTPAGWPSPVDRGRRWRRADPRAGTRPCAGFCGSISRSAACTAGMSARGSPAAFSTTLRIRYGRCAWGR